MDMFLAFVGIAAIIYAEQRGAAEKIAALAQAEYWERKADYEFGERKDDDDE